MDEVICVLGLGLMGRPVARTLLAAGCRTMGWNRSPLPEQVVAGIPLVRTVKDAASATVCILSLADSDAVDAVLSQLEPHLRPSRLVIDMGTSDPSRSRAHAARLTATGMLTHAALSPDGKYVVYTDNPGGRQSLWLRRVGDTTPLELIPPRPVGYWGVEFARDSGSIFYAVKGSDDPGGSLYRIPLLGGPSRKLLSGIDSPAALSERAAEVNDMIAAWTRKPSAKSLGNATSERSSISSTMS